MPLTILYFAAAREAAGTARETIAVAPARVSALRGELAARHPALAQVLPRCRVALDQQLADDDAPVPPDAEVAIIPPVSGGAPACWITERPLDLADVVGRVRSTGRGAVVTFQGDVRGETRGRKVMRLEYEAYIPMAERALARIASDVEGAHGAAVSIAHRVGRLLPGEAAVVIACAAAHRTPAFRACETTIERLKREVPIWKHEVFEDGAAWVGMGP